MIRRILTTGLVLGLLGGLVAVPPASADAESLARARAAAAAVDAAVAELKALPNGAGRSNPDAVRAAGGRLRTATETARALLDGYVKERGPVGSEAESAVVVRMVAQVRTGRNELRRLTGVNTRQPTRRGDRNRVNRLATKLARAAVQKRLNELGLAGVVTPQGRRMLRQRAEERIRGAIRAESSNILVQATAASLLFRTSARQETDKLVRERVSALVTRLVVKGNPLKGFVLRLIGADRLIDGVVRKTLPIVSWAPRQVVRFFRRVGRLNLNQRARRSNGGLERIAARLRRQGRAATTHREALALIRQAERESGAVLNLREELKRAGRTKLLADNTRFLTRLANVALFIEKRFGVGTELFAKRRAFRNELAALETEIGRTLDRYDPNTAPDGTGGTPGTAGRATRASCLSPIQVDTGVFDTNINDYAVASVEDKVDSIVCNYVRTDAPENGGPSLTIWFGEGRGRCNEATNEPVRDSTGTRHSTRREISAILIWSGSWRLAGPEGWPENVIRAAEAEGAGRPCPGGAPI